MSDVVGVRVGTDEEQYPVLSIGLALGGHGEAFDVPVALMDALSAARSAVDAIESAIMEHIGQKYPDASDVQEWLKNRRNDAILESIRDEWERDHPGLQWHKNVEWEERHRLLVDAGWQP